MKRIPKPFKYVPYEQTMKPGYLKARMAFYRQQVESEKLQKEQDEAERKEKVKQLRGKA
jgi:hypothetical protein